MPKSARPCPNCCDSSVEDHLDNGCVLNALIVVLRDREAMSEKKLRNLHANCDADAFWEDVGHIIDDLEYGNYSTEDVK